jgi:hypothetical protein
MVPALCANSAIFANCSRSTQARTAITVLAGAGVMALPHLAEAQQYHPRTGAEERGGVYFSTAAGTHAAGRM